MLNYEMLKRAIILIFAISAFSQANADDPLSPFVPGMTFKEAMLIAPEYNWGIVHNDRSGDPQAAVSVDELNWLDIPWTISIGEKLSFSSSTDISSLDFEASIENSNKKECKNLLVRAISELEPYYGPFGLHPDLPNERSKLYGNPLDGKFSVKSITENSKARLFKTSYGVTTNITFKEPNDDEFHRIMVKSEYIKDYKSCDLRVNIFIPYEWDKENEKFIIPATLKAKYPSRYRERPTYKFE